MNLALLSAVSLLSCSEPAANMPEPTSVQLSFSPTSATVPAGEPVRGRLSVRNDGAAPVWLNRRFLWNAGHARPFYREVWFTVRGPDAAELPFTCKVRAGAATAEDYALLGPGEQLTEDVELSQCFDLSQPGTYEVQAHYGDGTQERPAAPQGALPLVESLDAPPVKIVVQARQP